MIVGVALLTLVPPPSHPPHTGNHTGYEEECTALAVERDHAKKVSYKRLRMQQSAIEVEHQAHLREIRRELLVKKSALRKLLSSQLQAKALQLTEEFYNHDQELKIAYVRERYEEVWAAAAAAACSSPEPELVPSSPTTSIDMPSTTTEDVVMVPIITPTTTTTTTPCSFLATDTATDTAATMDRSNAAAADVAIEISASTAVFAKAAASLSSSSSISSSTDVIPPPRTLMTLPALSSTLPTPALPPLSSIFPTKTSSSIFVPPVPPPVSLASLLDADVDRAWEQYDRQRRENIHVLHSYHGVWDAHGANVPPTLRPYGLFDQEIDRDMDHIRAYTTLAAAQVHVQQAEAKAVEAVEAAVEAAAPPPPPPPRAAPAENSN